MSAPPKFLAHRLFLSNDKKYLDVARCPKPAAKKWQSREKGPIRAEKRVTEQTKPGQNAASGALSECLVR